MASKIPFSFHGKAVIAVVLCSAGICLAHFGPLGFETAAVFVDDVNTYANVVLG